MTRNLSAWISSHVKPLVLTGIMFITGSMQTMAYWFLETFPWLATIG